MTSHVAPLYFRLPVTWRQHARGLSPLGLPPDLCALRAPDLRVSNQAYEDDFWRKLHLELATIGPVQAVHAVMYPRPLFDVPILGVDLVSRDGSDTCAIVDTCPVTDDLSLPADYELAVRALQAEHGIAAASRLDMPAWGRPIFSDACVVLRAPLPDEFSAYVLDLVGMHMTYCAAATASRDWARIRANHSRFCVHQLRNGTARLALARSVGPDTAAAYMRSVVFDSV